MSRRPDRRSLISPRSLGGRQRRTQDDQELGFAGITFGTVQVLQQLQPFGSVVASLFPCRAPQRLLAGEAKVACGLGVVGAAAVVMGQLVVMVFQTAGIQRFDRVAGAAM